MTINAQLALRDFLTTEATLNDYCQTYFGKAPTHIVGYKRAPIADDYPVLNYVPIQTEVDGLIYDKELVGLVIGVNEPGIVNNVMQGHVRVAELADIVLTAINPGHLAPNATYINQAKIIFDMGERHPFYEAELQLQLLWRR